jgi:fused signal recognition particle receptor
MFDFLKKRLKGFVDNFKKEDEEKEPEEPNDILRDDLEELEHEIEEANAIGDSESTARKEELAISPDDISQAHIHEKEYESEIKAKKSTIPTAPKKDEYKESYSDIDESIIIGKEEKTEKKGFFNKIAESITKRSISDDEFDRMFHDLEISLLENNTAVEVVEKIKESLRKEITKDKVQRRKPHEIIREGLIAAIGDLFVPHEPFMSKIKEKKPYTIMFLGVNGSGKTTTIAKLAYKIKNNGMVPVLAAGDTFRAAAIQQLEEHAKKIGVRIIKHDYGADPAAVAFDAVKHAESGKAEIVLIDTAGRLHSNDNLLKELEKIKRVSKPDMTIFIGEAIAGNDVIEQASVFNEKIGIDGIILTKADVDDKGGAALSVSYITKAPIYFIGLGQEYEDLKEFTPQIIMGALGLND